LGVSGILISWKIICTLASLNFLWREVFVGGRGDGRGNLTNVQYKAIWNWHNESFLYNEYYANKNERNSFGLSHLSKRGEIWLNVL
jgi:hypothetical protein